jgi:glycosyltransferase involved in cell wall biosynthesis
MLARVKRCVIETEDWLRYSPLVRNVMGRVRLLSEGVGQPRDDDGLARSISKLCAAARLTTDESTLHEIQRRIHGRVRLLNPFRVRWKEWVDHYDDGRLVKAAILKPWLGPRERGVLFISFENQWIKLLTCRTFDKLAERYTLVVAPSSSPHNVINYVFPGLFPTKVFTLISNPEDEAALPGISANYVVVPLLASHWVDPNRFEPLPRAERDIDLIMVAGFGKVKRHHALFTALGSMPRTFRILLVGQDQDARTAASIHEEARWYGVADRFTVLSNQDYAGVSRALCRSRASVVLSRREGACVVVAEALFANTPVALLHGAQIGSRVFINDATGRFLPEDDLARQLTAFVAAADRYQPRLWAEQNISCFHSTRRLNDVLKQHMLADGREWTQDIVPLTWCPDPRPALAEDRRRLEDECCDLKQRFGLEIGS